METKNKVACITGASSGIGFSIATMLKEQGYTIVCIAKDICTNFDYSYECNLAKYEEIEQCFAKIYDNVKQIDVLVNCAGFGINGALEFCKDQDVANIFAVNTAAIVSVTNKALKIMNRGAKIVNISSMAAFGPTPYRVVYGATKAAVNCISYGYYMELKNSGISVCSVCPGDVDSNFQKNRILNTQTNSRYNDAVNKDLQHLEKRKNKRLKIEDVSGAVVKQLKKKNMKPLLIVGKGYKFFNFASKILPTKIYLNIINKSLNKSK